MVTKYNDINHNHTSNDTNKITYDFYIVLSTTLFFLNSLAKILASVVYKAIKFYKKFLAIYKK